MLRERQRAGEGSVREETAFLTGARKCRQLKGPGGCGGGGGGVLVRVSADVPGQAESIMGWIPSHQVGAL